MLADHAVAVENDVVEAKPGVAEIQVSESGKLVGLLEDLSRRLKKLETATATAAKKKPTDAHKQTRIVPLRHSSYLMYKPNRLCLITKMLLDKMFQWQSTHEQRTLHVFFKLVGQSKVVTLASGEITEARHGSAEDSLPSLSPSKLLYFADKRNKCNYLIDTGAAVSVLPKSCANRTSDATCLPLVAANNATINTYGTSRRVVDVGLKHDYAWTFIVPNIKQPMIGADFLIHYSLLKKSLSERHANRFSYTSYFIIY